MIIEAQTAWKESPSRPVAGTAHKHNFLWDWAAAASLLTQDATCAVGSLRHLSVELVLPLDCLALASWVLLLGRCFSGFALGRRSQKGSGHCFSFPLASSLRGDGITLYYRPALEEPWLTGFLVKSIPSLLWYDLIFDLSSLLYNHLTESGQ